MERLIIDGLVKSYGAKARARRAVDGLRLDLPRGTVLGLLGPNGSGKTTTVKCVASILDYDGGSIEFGGLSPRRHRSTYLARLGAVLEGARNVHWRLTARENMDYYAGLRDVPGRTAKSRVTRLASTLALEGALDTLVGRLSRGNQQRVALACALMNEPSLLLLDEPTLGLDVESVGAIRALIPALAREGAAVLVTSHDMHLIEAVCDRVAVVRSGQVIAEGSPASLRAVFGAHRLSVRVRSSEAASALGVLGDAERHDEGDGTTILRAAATNPKEALDLAARLAPLGDRVIEVELGRPSLEDAFRALVAGESAGKEKS